MKLFSPPYRALKTVGCGAIVALSLGLASQAQAQVNTAYVTHFDNLAANNSLSGQDGWTDSDANSPDSVAVFGGYSTTPTDLLASLGGAYISSGGGPSQATAYLSHGFNPVGTAYTFDTDFAVTSSTTPYTNNNSFGFAFHSATGTLFSVDLVPVTSPQTGTTVDAVRYSVYSNPVTGTFTQTSTGLGTSLNARYHLSLSVNETANTMEFEIFTENAMGKLSAPAYVSPQIALSTAGAGSTITSFGAVYNVAPSADGALPGSGAGSNTLLFDNLSVIPEPSTYAMLGLGLAGLVVRFRRKVRA